MQDLADRMRLAAADRTRAREAAARLRADAAEKRRTAHRHREENVARRTRMGVMLSVLVLSRLKGDP